MKTLLLLLAALPLCAQQSVHVDLSGEWRISPDDDLRYAGAAFNDSAWKTVRLPWKEERPIGVYWLRRTVEIPTRTKEPTALAIGSVNETYQLFINGTLIAETPGFGADDPPYFQPRSFAVPDQLLTSGRLVVALRIWRPKRVVWIRPEYGADFGPYSYASGTLAANAVENAFQQRLIRRISFFTSIVIYLFIGLYVLSISCSAPEWPDLKWISGFLLANSILNLVIVLLSLRFSYSWTGFVTAYSLSLAINLGCLAEFARSALGIRAGAWRFAAWLPLPIALVQYRLPETLILPAFLPAVLCVTWSLKSLLRKHEILIATLIGTYSMFRINLIAAGLDVAFFPVDIVLGPVRLPTSSIISVTIATTLAFLALKRLLREKNEKQRLSSELDAARQVQQLLLPSTNRETSHYFVDIVYRPAQEVGGDFYHVLECEDGALILVAGDVSGKGLKAAMLVSMITGALRHEERRQPAAILAALGRALSRDMQGGFATSCCARLEPGGRIIIANAGHPSPYVDGREVETAAGLPLGIVRDAEYEETTITMGVQGLLTFVSDGVVEAQNSKAELYGFDRTRDIATKPAADIADAAQAWGQNDDITVVTVRRNA